MPRVFILNDGGHDYSDAERFGEIVFCSKEVIHRNDISQMYRVLSQALYDAKSTDYLLISSLTSMCSIATGILASTFGVVHFLIFEQGKYVEKTVLFDD